MWVFEDPPSQSLENLSTFLNHARSNRALSACGGGAANDGLALALDRS